MILLCIMISFLIVLLLIAFFTLKKQSTALRSILSFMTIFLILASGPILENPESLHMDKAVDLVKKWIQPVEAQTEPGKNDVFVPVIKIKDHVKINAPLISQLPELPRGCEVTSLAMLLQHAGVPADKMELAKEIRKNPAAKKVKHGKIYYGDPNEGFVGNMYTFSKPGLGVYHQPIKELADLYLPDRVLDLTGIPFQELKIHLSDSRPVWVIINTSYKRLNQSQFETWYTPNGEISVTYKEHAVLVTGYDDKYVYFNDPLTGKKNKKAPIRHFEEAWVQMGKQAITYLPN
ncbi:C39 family peptidase [Mesobacillus foraminis]|uniref:C39 family peptidase n=1 Tax=Mesobacillus foraminis TaxID=279826 RepID=UPI000EF4FB26|nr:C39 family peptidase [Mesobacillus foraminis]